MDNLDTIKICETVRDELDTLLQNPSERKISQRILLLKQIQEHLKRLRDKNNAAIKHRNKVNYSKNCSTRPLQNEIITLDDFEFQDDNKIECNDVTFDNFSSFENKPAHLSIFIQYLISYATPHPVLFHLICKQVLTQNKSGYFFTSAYSLYCNFLAKDAPMPCNVDALFTNKLLFCLKKSSLENQKKCEKLLEMCLEQNEIIVRQLLKEFNEKRSIGLGIFYGEQYLHSKLDEKNIHLIIKDTLWTNFEKYYLDSSTEKNACTAAALASVLRIFNFTPTSNKNFIECCSNYFPNRKSRIYKEKIETSYLTLYGHDCENLLYSKPVCCYSCSRLVCHIGNVGFTCKNCNFTFHQICLRLDSRVCSKDNDISKTIRRDSQMSDNTINNSKSGIAINDKNETFDEANQSSKIKVFCRSSVDSISRNNKEFADSDLEYDETTSPSWEKFVDSNILSVMTSTEKRRQDAINEFFSTEKFHVRSLKIMHNVYYVPMCKTCEEEFVELIFPNLKTLIRLHVSLNKDFKLIKSISQDGVTSQFADVLVKHFTGRYGEKLEESTALFCQKQSTAIQEINRRQKKDQKFNQILTAANNNRLCRRLNLKDSLPTIVQRFTKYPLLVDNVLKYTPGNSVEYSKLKLVRAATRKMVQSVDGIINEYANMQYMNVLVNKIEKINPDVLFIHPSLANFTNFKISNHKLLYFGDFQWKISKSRSIDVQLLLLNNIIILLQKIDKRLILKFETLLNCEKLKSYSTFSPILKLDDVLIKNVANDSLAFFIICVSTLGPQMFQLVCKSVEEKNAWHKRIQNAKEKLTNSQQQNRFESGEAETGESKQPIEPLRNGFEIEERNKTKNGLINNDDDDDGDVDETETNNTRLSESEFSPNNSTNSEPGLTRVSVTGENSDCEIDGLTISGKSDDVVGRKHYVRSNSSFIQDPRLDLLREAAAIAKLLSNPQQPEAQDLFLNALKGIHSLSDDQVINVSKLLRQQMADCLDELRNGSNMS